jgi:flagellar L-ring protein precursor FlgH
LIVEGHRAIQNNNEMWTYSLTGEIRPEDINKQTNTVQSEQIAQLRITKREGGNVRDGYRRGWLQRALDQYQLF